MGFKMQFKQDQLKGFEPVPAGTYEVRFVEFKPAKNKGGDSVNLNATVAIVGHPEWEKERQLRAPLSLKVPNIIQDFVHSFGLEMADQLGDDPAIPGNFDGEQDKPETWKYMGPLTNKTATWEVGEGTYNEKPTNTLRKFICKVPNCATKFPQVSHSNDMAKKG